MFLFQNMTFIAFGASAYDNIFVKYLKQFAKYSDYELNYIRAHMVTVKCKL